MSSRHCSDVDENDDNVHQVKKSIEKISANASSQLTKEKLEKLKKKADRRGVIYISRVPPFMKAEKLRHLLGEYGDIHRIYLVPEDKSHYRKRVAAGGNRKEKFTEGWIEFEDKKVAKAVAKMLNTKNIGGRKRNYYHDDMWNLKYLKKFKWDHLTEKIAYEKRIRAQKLRLEIAQGKKENEEYLERVEESKKFDSIEKRKLEKRRNSMVEDGDKGSEHTRARRHFTQKQLIKKQKTE